MCKRKENTLIDESSSKKFKFLPLLAEKNAHPKDVDIKFRDDGHLYWIKGCKNNVVSTTSLLGKYIGAFDPDFYIGRIQKSKRYFSDPTYKYYRLMGSEIKAMWSKLGSDAAAAGTENHLQLELFYNGQIADFSRYEHSVLFREFDKEHMSKLEPFRTEMLMFHEDLRITGSADIIYKNRETGKLVLGDFKFIKKLSKSGKKSKAPFEHLPDCNYSKYSLQLSIYRYILETEYGYEFEDQFLLLLHKNQSKYIKVHTPYYVEEVEKLFEIRQMQLDAINRDLED